jgi:hypothetical protein
MLLNKVSVKTREDQIVLFDRWADKFLSVQSTYVKNYSEHIKEWNERGSSRWDLSGF